MPLIHIVINLILDFCAADGNNIVIRILDLAAEQMFDQLMRQCAAAEGITEETKATDQLAWVRQMNGIRSRVTEIVNAELMYQ